MLETERLILRPFAITDATDVQRLAGAREVALNTMLIPHPYPDGAAEEWIRGQDGKAAPERVLAITLRTTGELLGAIGLRVNPEHQRAELGYWIGVPYWGRGYASEAGKAMLAWGFGTLGLELIFAMPFTRNPASGRVLAHLGMQHEGSLRKHVVKWDERVDVELWGILREEWKVRGEVSS